MDGTTAVGNVTFANDHGPCPTCGKCRCCDQAVKVISPGATTTWHWDPSNHITTTT